MGPYCRYCNRRCFLQRVLLTGKSILLATCPAGMNHDLAATGETHETAVNPILDPEGAARRFRNPQLIDASAFCGFCTHHVHAHTFSAGAEDIPCVGCRGGVCAGPDTCDGCGSAIKLIAGTWTVVGTRTSADGLTYCPPNPDADPAEVHRPRRLVAELLHTVRR